MELRSPKESDAKKTKSGPKFEASVLCTLASARKHAKARATSANERMNAGSLFLCVGEYEIDDGVVVDEFFVFVFN